MFWELSSNIVGKLSPNIVIYRLVGTDLDAFKQWLFIEPNYLPKIEKLGPYILILLVFNAFFADHSMVFFFKFVLRMKLLKQSFVYIERRGGQYI